MSAGFGAVPEHAMSPILFVVLTLICWASAVKAEVLSFSCSGIIKSEEQQAKPHAITNMELVVNFDAGVVSGFTAITARIEEANANSVLFNGTTLHPSGAEWSVRGAMNRITGSLGATVTWLNRRTNDLLMRMNYELICKPTNEASGK
jgi:hypothetical protein